MRKVFILLEENILRFQKDYPNTKVVKLEQNYRSSQNILNAANKVISINKNQIPKNLWTDKSDGEQIKLVSTLTDNDEGRFVADAIAEQKLRNHYRNSDFAILYRTNAQSRSFEESLRKHGIAYRIFGGLSFYQRKEIKDFIAYMRIVVNPQDEEALKRIINYPTRGIGKTSLDRLTLAANESGNTFWEVLQNPAVAGLKGAAGTTIENFVIMIKSFQSMLKIKNAYEVAFEIGKQTELVKTLHLDKSVEGMARYENVQELLNSIKAYTETPDDEGELAEDKSLGTYLQQITLLTDADKEEENEDVVKLMTIHASKGLEFQCVFAVGLEENIFPSAMSLYDRENLEEERRLFYVVITRAKERLWVSFSKNRYRFGSLVQNDPSRFIDEIPPDYVDKAFVGLAGARSGGASSSQFSRPTFQRKTTTTAESTSSSGVNVKQILEQRKNQSFQHIPSDNFEASDPDTIEVGMQVEHQKFGVGTIKQLEGGVHNRIASVEFDKAGSKKIMLSFAKLMILN